MVFLQSQASPFITSARTAYRSVRELYRKVRSIKNRALNLVDPPVVVLVYHRVTDLPSDPELLAVTPGNFRLQMEFLKRHCHIVRFEDDWSRLRTPAVAVTFDDGYADNLLEALPVLEEVGIPATFFVSTERIGTGKEFWWHTLEGILLRSGEFPSRFQLNDPRFGGAWETTTLEKRKILYTRLNLYMRKIAPERQAAWLNQLASWAGRCEVEPLVHRCMSREELRKLAESPCATIGAHTVTHSALSALGKDDQRNEIFQSKKDLEDILGAKITTFSYPFGRKQDYNRISILLCREAGFEKAASNFPGQVHNWTDQFQIPRHLVRNWDLKTFAAELEKFWTR